MKIKLSDFSKDAVELLGKLGIVIDEQRDYSFDELFKMSEIIEDSYDCNGFLNDEPVQPLCGVYEQIMDTFYDKYGI